MKTLYSKVIGFILVAVLTITCIPVQKTNATQSRTGNFSRAYSLGSNDADNMVAIATAQLGKTKAQLGYTEAWCADFVSDCAKLAEISGIIPANGSCYYLYNAILNAGGQVVSSPQKGDLVFYYCKSCQSVPWVHVGIMVNSSQSIEGNYGGKVSSVNGAYRDCYDHTVASGIVVRKFVRPAYNSRTCGCSTNYAGNYIVNTSSQPLNIRNSHGGGSIIGSIPKGEKVYVSKADGAWAHVSYNGISGLCAMEYLSKEAQGTNPHGVADTISGGGGNITVTGWAFDNDDIGKDLDIHVYIGGPAGSGAECHPIKANKLRKDVNAVYGTGDYHGYADVIWTNRRGKQDVYVYAINVGSGTSNPLLGHAVVDITDSQIMLRTWFSDDKMGDKVTECYVNEDVIYLCYELFEKETGVQLNQIENCNYTVKETIYNPDGSECYSTTYESSDYNWIRILPKKSGTYRGKIEITGDKTGTMERTIEVKDRETYTITYEGNGGNSYPSAQVKTENKVYTIAQCNGQRMRNIDISANGGYFSDGTAYQGITYMENFSGWNTKKDGSGTNYSAGSSYNQNANLTLYAQYACRKLGALSVPVRENYEFVGWNTKMNGTGEWLTRDSLVSSDLKIYAQWKEIPVPRVTPTPTVKPTATLAPIVTPTVKPTITPVPTATPVPTVKATVTPVPTATPTVKPTITPVPTATPAPTVTPTVTPTATSEPTINSDLPSPKPPVEEPKVCVSKNYAKQGDIVPITVSLINNPGITSITLDVSYDTNALSLESVENAKLLNGAVFSQSSLLTTNPYRLIWNVGSHDVKTDGKLVTLYFKVKQDVVDGEYTVSIHANGEDIFDTTLQNVNFQCVNGGIEVTSLQAPGDVNHDGFINTKDATLITQYYAGWDVEIDLSAADVNGDGTVNTKDATLITQYYAGWDVKLKGGR